MDMERWNRSDKRNDEGADAPEETPENFPAQQELKTFRVALSFEVEALSADDAAAKIRPSDEQVALAKDGKITLTISELKPWVELEGRRGRSSKTP